MFSSWLDVFSPKSKMAAFFVRRGQWDLVEEILIENCRKHREEILYGVLSRCGKVDTYEILDSECWRNRLVLNIAPTVSRIHQKYLIPNGC